ncbi:hypothetical protein ScPMuIL_006906 [Solemya velum]
MPTSNTLLKPQYLNEIKENLKLGQARQKLNYDKHAGTEVRPPLNNENMLKHGKDWLFGEMENKHENPRDECKSQVDKFPKARYKKFGTREEALEFVNCSNSTVTISNSVEAVANHTLYECTCQNKELQRRTATSKCDDVRSKKKQISHLSTSENGIVTEETVVNQRVYERKRKNKGFQKQAATAKNDELPSKKKRAHSSSSENGSVTEETVVNQRVYERKRKNKGFQKQAATAKNDELPSKKKRAHSSSSENGSVTGCPFADSDGVIVYTDGACFDNGKCGSRAGIGVYWGPHDHRNVSERLTGRATNNRAEIHAARKAIIQAKEHGIKNLILNTDSAFLINAITKWIKGWKRNGWILTTGLPVINREDFEQLDQELRNINVKWKHVRGHVGIPGNEAADRLANAGAKKQLE